MHDTLTLQNSGSRWSSVKILIRVIASLESSGCYYRCCHPKVPLASSRVDAIGQVEGGAHNICGQAKGFPGSKRWLRLYTLRKRSLLTINSWHFCEELVCESLCDTTAFYSCFVLFTDLSNLLFIVNSFKVSRILSHLDLIWCSLQCCLFSP